MRFVATIILLAIFVAAHVASYALGAVSFSRWMGGFDAADYALYAAAAIEVAKGGLLFGAVFLLSRRTWGDVLLGLAVGVAWTIVVAFSVLASKGTVADTFERSAFSGGRVIERRAEIERDLREAEKRLAVMGNPRPARVVAGDVERLKIQRPFTTSEGCTAISGSAERTFCDKYLAAMAEQAAIQGYEEARGRITLLREEHRKLGYAAGTDPMVQAWQSIFGAQSNGRDWIALLAVVGIELLSCIGLTVVGRVWARPSVETTSKRSSLQDAKPHISGPVRDAVDLPLGEGSRPLPAGLPAHPSATGRGRVGTVPQNLSAPMPRPLPPEPGERVEYPSPKPVVPSPASGEGCASVQPLLHSANASPSAVKSTPPHQVSNPSPPSPRGSRLGVVNSPIAAFVRSCVDRTDGAATSGADFIAAYQAWCRAAGQEPQDWQVVARELTGLGFTKRKSRGVMVWERVRLRHPVHAVTA